MTIEVLTHSDTTAITAECTVEAVIARSPSAIAILNAHNIDTCCGGRATIGVAALHAHVDVSELVALLQAAPARAETSTPDAVPAAKSCNCGGH